jgi:hypothetical protein
MSMQGQQTEAMAAIARAELSMRNQQQSAPPVAPPTLADIERGAVDNLATLRLYNAALSKIAADLSGVDGNTSGRPLDSDTRGTVQRIADTNTDTASALGDLATLIQRLSRATGVPVEGIMFPTVQAAGAPGEKLSAATIRARLDAAPMVHTGVSALQAGRY